MKKEERWILRSPEPVLRHPRRLFSEMWLDLIASRDLAWILLVRNIRVKYRQTALGYLWAFVPPIAMTLIWVMLKSQNVVAMGGTDIPYAVYVFVGTILWQIFLEALNSPVNLVTSSKQMLSKVNFPREALIIAGIGEVFFGFLIRAVLLVGVLVWFKIEVPPTIVVAPIGVATLIAFGVMIGVFLSPVGALYDDVQHGIATLTTLWFFLTPVVYPPPTEGFAAHLMKWNPVSPILLQTRDWCTTGTTSYLAPFIFVLTLTVVLSAAGWLLYRIAMPHVIARMRA